MFIKVVCPYFMDFKNFINFLLVTRYTRRGFSALLRRGQLAFGP